MTSDLVPNAQRRSLTLRAISEDLAETTSKRSDRRRSRGSPATDLDYERLFWQTLERFDLLTPDQELALARRAARGDDDARSSLVLANLRLVADLARRYHGQSGLDALDLMQEGTIGLIAAIDRFDPERGYKLSTYAVWWIKKALFQAVADKARVIRVPLYKVLELNRLRQRQAHLSGVLGRDPTEVELAADLERPVKQIRQDLGTIQRTLSLDSPADGLSERSLGDHLSDTTAAPPDEAAASVMRTSHLEAIVASLPAINQEVLRLRYGLNDDQPRSLAEIGRALGVSRDQAGQLEASTLESLRARPDVQPLRDAAYGRDEAGRRR